MAASQYRHTDLTEAQARQRNWCGRHRLPYVAWEQRNGKVTAVGCPRCASNEPSAEVARAARLAAQFAKDDTDAQG